MGSNKEKKPWNNLQTYKKIEAKRLRATTIAVTIVGRAITKWGAIEKSPILLSQYWKNYHF